MKFLTFLFVIYLMNSAMPSCSAVLAIFGVTHSYEDFQQYLFFGLSTQPCRVWSAVLVRFLSLYLAPIHNYFRVIVSHADCCAGNIRRRPFIRTFSTRFVCWSFHTALSLSADLWCCTGNILNPQFLSLANS